MRHIVWWIGLVAVLPAQELRWRLPEAGAAEFGREWTAQSQVLPTRQAAEQCAPNGPVPEKYLPKWVAGPWLCQGELDRPQTAVAAPPRDLRELLRSVALDLSLRGAVRIRSPRLPPFGDLVLAGSVQSSVQGGTQGGGAGDESIEMTVDRRAPEAQPGDVKGHKDLIAVVCTLDVAGRLRIRRTVDAAAGLVRAYEGRLELVIPEGGKQFRKLVVSDRWRLLAVRENQDADFRERVRLAVSSGARYVRENLEGGDESFLRDKGGEDRTFGSGRLALGVLTLLHTNVPREDPVLSSAVQLLRRRNLEDTYAIAVALMAMAQFHAPPGEAARIRLGEQTVRQPRQLDERDRKLVQGWVEELLGNVDKRSDPAKRLRFNYVAGPRYDNSLTQYGLLGLDAAVLCGVAVPDTAWEAAGRHFLAELCDDGGRSVDLQLTTYRELAAAAGEGAPTVRSRRAQARGFAYFGAGDPAYGGMTAAGIAGMTIARAGLERQGGRSPVAGALDRGIDEAMAWLAAEFTVRHNPGFVGKSDRHLYYWLYGLERACELLGIAHIQGRDWYYEGALQLLSQQQPNGSFRADMGGNLVFESTCLAILFLARSTPAVITGR